MTTPEPIIIDCPDCSMLCDRGCLRCRGMGFVIVTQLQPSGDDEPDRVRSMNSRNIRGVVSQYLPI